VVFLNTTGNKIFREEVRIQNLVSVRRDITMIWPCKKNGQNKDTKTDVRIKINSNEAYVITLGKTVYPGTQRHQEERKELARNQKRKPMGRRKRL
jgi:hypothetical protein